MRFDSVIDLIILDGKTDQDGFGTPNVLERKTVYAQKSDIRSNEFYAASKSGYSLKLMFLVLALEYSSQKHLEYETNLYEIIRTYKNGKYTELICQAYVDSP
jgi:hypothetical protein